MATFVIVVDRFCSYLYWFKIIQMGDKSLKENVSKSGEHFSCGVRNCDLRFFSRTGYIYHLRAIHNMQIENPGQFLKDVDKRLRYAKNLPK